MNLSTRIVDAPEEFARLESSWHRLLYSAIGFNTFMSHAWLWSWWEAYAPNARLYIVVAESSGDVVGIAPMMIETRWQAGLPLPVLRFIGDGTHETDHIGFIVDRDAFPAACDALMAAVASLPWQVALLNQMPAESPVTQRLLRAADERGWRLRSSAVACPRRLLPPSYEALLASMPPRLRTALRSSRKKLEKSHAVEFGLHSEADELPIALNALFENHASRWRAKGQAGVFVDPRKRRFYELLSVALMRDGVLRFFYLKVDGRIVAQQYCFEHDGVVMLLQEGFDYAHAADNVGNVLRSHVFEYLINRGARVYDFLAGESRHKRSWSDGKTDDLRVELTRGPLGAAYAWPRQLRDALKNWLRPMLRPVAAQPSEESS